MKNWWYYHKWYVIGGVLLLLITANLIGNAFGWFRKAPDLQIAYIGEAPLPDDTAAALRKAFASLAGDFNHDGDVLVQINQFICGGPENTDMETASYQQAFEIALNGDINDCDSYFFLMENPADFQKKFQVLAMPDGSCPAALDYSVDGKVFQWASCRLLSEIDLGDYTTTLFGHETSGSNQEILSQLYLGRRCFYGKEHTSNADECSQLWNTLKGDFN